MIDNSHQISRLLRGTTKVISEEELKKKLAKGKPLRIKLGVDPTAPDIHLGHTVVLTKLRTFQEMGHKIIFIIGDFTAAIGDPSGRDTTRPPLSNQDISQNIQTYTDQVYKILDEKKTEVHCNGEWLYDLFDKNSTSFLPRTLLRQHTVQQLMERDDFTERRKAGLPITLLELMYPLFQGYDSVAVKADVEIGGHDQLFNLLMGRDIQKDAGQDPQVIMTMPLLEGLDGIRKMSKSYGNHIGLKDPPNEMFAKIMSVSDEIMWKYYELLTEENLGEVKNLHPKLAKEKLAELITTQYHGAELGATAREVFNHTFSKQGIPDDIETFSIPDSGIEVADLIFEAGCASSKKEARRLLDQGGVEIDGIRSKFGDRVEKKATAQILKVGKRRFKRLI